MKITMSFADHNTVSPKGFKSTNIDFWSVHEKITAGVAYSQYSFKDNYRIGTNNFGNINVLCLDFDDGMTIKEAQEKFKKVNHLIIVTKSHQKNKGGKICDRYRVILPLSTPMTIPVKEYPAMLDFIYRRIGSVDGSTKDIARFFFASPANAQYQYHVADKNLDWTVYYRMMMKEQYEKEEARKQQKKYEPRSGGVQSNTLPATTSIETRRGLRTLGGLRDELSIGDKVQCKCLNGFDHADLGNSHYSAFVRRADNGNIYYKCSGGRCSGEGLLWCED